MRIPTRRLITATSTPSARSWSAAWPSALQRWWRLEADGTHSRIDALVSAGAFAGIGLAGLGLKIADPLLGLGISAAIVYIMGGTVKQLYYRMMDRSIPR